MTDVDHELGAIRFVVDAPLSSKVAMFNNVANQHKESQFLNPFSNAEHRQRTFNKDEYGKPLAGSLTEMRGARANIHVCKEMLQLCQIIDTEGFVFSEDEPNLKVILFGDLFNIYTLISDKVVGLLLRARKYKLIDFEGEVLFQRRDDDVPVYMLKPIDEIKQILEEKQEEVRRSVSPAPQSTRTSLDSRSGSPVPTRGNLSRSVSPAPQLDSSSRGTSPAPIERGKSRSVSPAPSSKQQKNLNSSVSSAATKEGNHSQSVSSAPNQINGMSSRSVSPAPTTSSKNQEESNKKQDDISTHEPKMQDPIDLKNTSTPEEKQQTSVSPESQAIVIVTTDSQ